MGSKYNVVIELNKIITEIIKLITLFGYLIIGYSLVKNEEYKLLFKSYSYFTILISVIGIMTLFVNVGSYRSILFFGTNRFGGLMNDPNYFSILQLLGLSIIVNDDNIKTPRKSIYILLIIFSIMMSNSKTGFLALIILGVILITNRVIKLEKHKRVYIMLSLPVIFLLGYVFRSEIVYLIADLPAKYIPGYERVAVLIKDFQEGVTGGGGLLETKLLVMH